jgi:hypothetical protein
MLRKAAKDEHKKRKVEEKVPRTKKAKSTLQTAATSASAPLAHPPAAPPTPAAPPPPPLHQHHATLAQKFITRPAAAGIAINAWFLLGHVHFLVNNPELGIPFNPRLLTEQAAEKVFRAARAVLGGENFTLAEFFRRCDRLTALAILRVLHESDFAFPEHDTKWKWDERRSSDDNAGPLAPEFSMTDARSAIMSAKLLCINDMARLGVDVHRFTKIYHLDDGTLDSLEPDEADKADEFVPPPRTEAVNILVVRNPHLLSTLIPCRPMLESPQLQRGFSLRSAHWLFKRLVGRGRRLRAHSTYPLRRTRVRGGRALLLDSAWISRTHGATSSRSRRPTVHCTRSPSCTHSPSLVGTRAAARTARCASKPCRASCPRCWIPAHCSEAARIQKKTNKPVLIGERKISTYSLILVGFQIGEPSDPR